MRPFFERGPIFVHSDPRIPKHDVDFVAEKLLATGELPFKKFFLEDSRTGWERVYAVKKIGDRRYMMTFALGCSHKELPDGPHGREAPTAVVSLTRFRIQQALGIRGRVLDPDVLPSYRFPWVACRLLSGAYRIVYVPGANDSSQFREQLQGLAEQLGIQVCLVVDENRAYYLEPGKPCGDSTLAPPRGGIWFSPAQWSPNGPGGSEA